MYQNQRWTPLFSVFFAASWALASANSTLPQDTARPTPTPVPTPTPTSTPVPTPDPPLFGPPTSYDAENDSPPPPPPSPAPERTPSPVAPTPYDAAPPTISESVFLLLFALAAVGAYLLVSRINRAVAEAERRAAAERGATSFVLRPSSVRPSMR